MRRLQSLPSVGVLALSWLLMCVIAPPVLAQDAAATRGNAVFNHSCAPCHGRGPGDNGRAMLPGTDALRLKYQGALPAALEDRKDLTMEVIRTYLRNGSMAMPPFRKTELSDAEIVDIAAYLQYASSRQ
jgi:mono/diheme cytochrome c family protein